MKTDDSDLRHHGDWSGTGAPIDYRAMRQVLGALLVTGTILAVAWRIFFYGG